MEPKSRVVLGAALDAVGSYLVPPGLAVLSGVLTNKITDGSPPGYTIGAIASMTMAGIIPAVGRWFGLFVGRKGRVDEALTHGLQGLMRCLLDPPATNDKHAPAVRATIFTPKKQLLVPRYRMSSASEDILSFGDKRFHETKSFEKGVGFAGKTWGDHGHYHAQCDALGDGGLTGDEAKAAWIAQWVKHGCNDAWDWSAYMRNVRSIWTFPIRGTETDSDLLAVVSLDSIYRNAFSMPEEVNPPAATPGSQSEDIPVFQVHLRQAIATAIEASVLVGVGAKRARRCGTGRGATGSTGGRCARGRSICLGVAGWRASWSWFLARRQRRVVDTW